MFTNRVRMAGVAAVVLAIVAGCSAGPKGPAGAVKVSGKVTCGGDPLPTGTVIFQGGGGTSVTARIEKGGTFTTMLMPGEHSVVVNAKDGVDTMDETGKPVPAKSLVPEKHSSGSTSGLTVTVTAKGDPLTISLEK
ncbi:MAG: hypothetical protein ACKOTB_17430 [Planctomycetia bacterium]